jgi:hypothetical protein
LAAILAAIHPGEFDPIETFAARPRSRHSGHAAITLKVPSRHGSLMPQDEFHASIEETIVARFWKERYASSRHSNKMKGECDGVHQCDCGLTPRDNLLVQWVYFVNVCQFDFQFLSLRQLEVCLEYFRKKFPGSSRISIGAADHWEVQRWFERLPKGLRREPNRLKIVKALERALTAFTMRQATGGRTYRPSEAKHPHMAQRQRFRITPRAFPG